MRPGPAGDDPKAELREMVEREVRAGYRSIDETAERCAEAFEEFDEVEDPKTTATRIARDVAKRLAVESLDWPETTDCDRLDDAFDALEEAGIVAREDFSCCGRCAPGEMEEEMDEAEADGRAVRGYAYFHEQDTEGAVESGTLYLGYGPRDPWDKDTAKFVAVGQEVAAALREHGLAVTWDGTHEQRIHVKLKWLRRGPWAESPAPDAPAPPPVAPSSKPVAPARPSAPAREEAPPPLPPRPSLSPGSPPETRYRIAVGAPGCVLIVMALFGAVGKKADSPRLALWLIALYAASAVAARIVLLMPRRRGRAAAKREDWKTAAVELGKSVALFQRLPWLDWLRWPLLFSFSDVQYRERDLPLLFHARARLGDADGAIEAANTLLRVYPESAASAEVRRRLERAGYVVR